MQELLQVQDAAPQGVSAAGAQEGLGDARSGLVRSVFTTFDAIPTMPISQVKNEHISKALN